MSDTNISGCGSRLRRVIGRFPSALLVVVFGCATITHNWGMERLSAQNPVSESPGDDSGAEESVQTPDVILVVGASGESEFGKAFTEWSDVWQATCRRTQLQLLSVLPDPEATSAVSQREQLQEALKTLEADVSSRPLWLVLIGHGTWGNSVANFNLVGPDVSAKTLNQWLSGIKRPVVVVNCSSSSGPFVDRLSGPNRVVVTATKSGSEQNFSRFGDFFASAFGSLDADLNHDDAVSAREAFLKAVSDVTAFYQQQGRLATEHAMLDDNNDRKGSSADLVSGKSLAKGDLAVDGKLADRFSIVASPDAIQLSEEAARQRDKLEQRLETLGNEYADDPVELRRQAMPVLVELGKLYAAAEAAR